MKSTKFICLALMTKFIFLIMESLCHLLVIRVDYKLLNTSKYILITNQNNFFLSYKNILLIYGLIRIAFLSTYKYIIFNYRSN